MPGLLIKNLPSDLHQQIKELAEQDHRSLMQEALTLLEEAITHRKKQTPPAHVPRKGKFPLTPEFLEEAINEGRP